MDKIVVALVSAFAAGFAVQQLLELVDAIFFGNVLGANKKAVLAWISFFAGLALSVQIRVLSVFVPTVNPVIDVFVSALVISAGTEGLNSILKFLSYKKEEQKAAAAQKQRNAGADALSLVNRQPATPDFDLPAPSVPV
ncbi:MAG TPA: hypothetical protein VHW00_04785 [Thermoanaerobaculia bacterium]|nr:hypothetical protein [Thermoanaerobaculia bacterium]